ncbi:hypothetical protein KIN20_021377 [Parelaphostrongylus tenuis]|uniref:Uncharacterized protein n=1 Tax=Parelaphostrongylus tenuis TaxID=148309 RepID=A0AAD5NAQ6_PARTN|nr:hypothetical protein KIN20_021377 [Parelaphostrongylus tenuis]
MEWLARLEYEDELKATSILQTSSIHCGEHTTRLTGEANAVNYEEAERILSRVELEVVVAVVYAANADKTRQQTTNDAATLQNAVKNSVRSCGRVAEAFAADLFTSHGYVLLSILVVRSVDV